MKRLLKYNLLILSVLSVHILLAGSLEERQKKIEKNFKVKQNTKLEISNQFGEVNVQNWDKSEFGVVIEIIVNGKSESRAEALLDKISIDIDETSSLISLETDMSGNMNTKNDESFEINYMIKMPAGNPLEVENKFGDVYLDDRNGTTELDVSYGNLKAGAFNEALDLELSFGDGSIERVVKAKVIVKYSKLEIEEAEYMDMEQQFSDVELEKVGQLILESKYGDVEIGEVDVIESDAQFSGFSIEILNESLELEASYVSDFEIDVVKNTFTRIDIEGKFSSYELNLEKGIKGELEAEFGFANLKNQSEQLEIYYQVKEDNRAEYKAKIGGGGSQKIIVKSSYGDLKLRDY